MKGEISIQSEEILITEKGKNKGKKIALHFKKLEMINEIKSKIIVKYSNGEPEDFLVYGLSICFFENDKRIKKGIIYVNDKEENSLIFLDFNSKLPMKIQLSKLSDINFGKNSGNFKIYENKIKKINEEICLTLHMKHKTKFFDFVFNTKEDLDLFCLGIVAILEKTINDSQNLKTDIINLKQIWKQYVSDTDKKHLNFQQFSQFLRNICFKWKKKTDEQIFKEIDNKNLGKIGFKDFISFYEFLVTGEEFREIFQKYSSDEEKKYITIRGLLEFMEKEQHLKITIQEIFVILHKFSKKTKKILEKTENLNNLKDLLIDPDFDNQINSIKKDLKLEEYTNENNPANSNKNLNEENNVNKNIANHSEKNKNKENDIKPSNFNFNSKNNPMDHESLQAIYDNYSFGKNNLLDDLKDGKKEDFYSTFCLSFREFVNFLIDKSYNSIYNYDLFAVHQNMNFPINEYFIYSSHNTYLEGNQMIGNSSIDMYINCLKNGCRLVELDCWDGKNGPIITHWHFPVNRLDMKEVLINIKDFAFKKSQFPVIFSIENHCNNTSQEMMAQYFIDIIGIENLFIVDTENPLLAYPSPNDLKKKFIIKCKRKRILGKKNDLVKIKEDINNHNLINKTPSNYKQNNIMSSNTKHVKGNNSISQNDNNIMNTSEIHVEKTANNNQNYNNLNNSQNNLVHKESNSNFCNVEIESNNYNQNNLYSNNEIRINNNFKQKNFIVLPFDNIENNNNLKNDNINDFINFNRISIETHPNIPMEIDNNLTSPSNNTFQQVNSLQSPNLIDENKKNILRMVQKEEIIEEVNSNNSPRNSTNNERQLENLLDSSNEKVYVDTDFYITRENIMPYIFSGKEIIKKDLPKKCLGKIKSYIDIKKRNKINLENLEQSQNQLLNPPCNLIKKDINGENKIKDISENKKIINKEQDYLNKNISLSSTNFTYKKNSIKKKLEFENIYKKDDIILKECIVNNNININNIDDFIEKNNNDNENQIFLMENLVDKNLNLNHNSKNVFNKIEKGSLKNITHTGIINNPINNLGDENNLIKNNSSIDDMTVKIKYLAENKELKFKHLNIEIKDPPINPNFPYEYDNNNGVNNPKNNYEVYKIKSIKKNKTKPTFESEFSEIKNEVQISQPNNSNKVFNKLKVKYLITHDNTDQNNINIFSPNNVINNNLNNLDKQNEESCFNTQTIPNNHVDYEVLTRMQEIRTLDELRPNQLKIKTIDKLAAIVGMIGVKYKQKDFDSSLYLPWECVSISEPDFNKYVINIDERIKLIKFCQKSFIKTYPDVVKRTDSSNHDPIISWASGVQIVALNLQKTDDDNILINKIFFKLNGGSKSGYILKPEILRNPNCDDAIKKLNTKIAFKIKFKILSGFHLHLCFPEKTKITGLFVEVSLRSPYNNDTDKDNKKLITNTIESNYLHPVWVSSSIHFDVYDPDFTFIIIKVFSKKKNVIARSVIPVKFMNLGIRVVDLYDNYCSKFENSFIIVKCNKIYSN